MPRRKFPKRKSLKAKASKRNKFRDYPVSCVERRMARAFPKFVRALERRGYGHAGYFYSERYLCGFFRRTLKDFEGVEEVARRTTHILGIVLRNDEYNKMKWTPFSAMAEGDFGEVAVKFVGRYRQRISELILSGGSRDA